MPARIAYLLELYDDPAKGNTIENVEASRELQELKIKLEVCLEGHKQRTELYASEKKSLRARLDILVKAREEIASAKAGFLEAGDQKT